MTPEPNYSPEVELESQSEEESATEDDTEDENESESDGTTSREKAYLSKKQKKTTVTSRGRVSKPNPRIV